MKYNSTFKWVFLLYEGSYAYQDVKKKMKKSP